MIVLVDTYVRNLLGNNGSTRTEWVRDIVVKNGGFDSYNADFDLYTMSNENFKYWRDFVCVEQDIIERTEALKNELECDILEQFRLDFENVNFNELLEIQSGQIEVIEKYEGEA